MRTIEVKLFQFDELSDEAKEKARDWYREGDEFRPLFEPFETAAKLLGITLGTTQIPLMNGKTRQETDIRYSGFSSQGDGASFVGSYEYAKGCSKAVRQEFGTDNTLLAIADGLTALQRKHGYKLVATITAGSSHYVHKYTMDVSFDNLDHEQEDIYAEMLSLMRDFAQWIYDGLRDEYDYQTSDEAVDENITANEYEFHEDGSRA